MVTLWPYKTYRECRQWRECQTVIDFEIDDRIIRRWYYNGIQLILGHIDRTDTVRMLVVWANPKCRTSAWCRWEQYYNNETDSYYINFLSLIDNEERYRFFLFSKDCLICFCRCWSCECWMLMKMCSILFESSRYNIFCCIPHCPVFVSDWMRLLVIY